MIGAQRWRARAGAPVPKRRPNAPRIDREHPAPNAQTNRARRHSKRTQRSRESKRTRRRRESKRTQRRREREMDQRRRESKRTRPCPDRRDPTIRPSARDACQRTCGGVASGHGSDRLQHSGHARATTTLTRRGACAPPRIARAADLPSAPGDATAMAPASPHSPAVEPPSEVGGAIASGSARRRALARGIESPRPGKQAIVPASGPRYAVTPLVPVTDDLLSNAMTAIRNRRRTSEPISHQISMFGGFDEVPCENSWL